MKNVILRYTNCRLTGSREKQLIGFDETRDELLLQVAERALVLACATCKVAR